MILAEVSVSNPDLVDPLFLLAVLVAIIGFVLAIMKIPVNLMIFVFAVLALGFGGLLCQ